MTILCVVCVLAGFKYGPMWCMCAGLCGVYLCMSVWYMSVYMCM